jgi:crossover junction endodeoxyribonuclease RuvC
MRIISIDPGYERLGIAVLERDKGKEVLLYSDCFKTSTKLSLNERIFLIGQEVESLIKKFKVDGFSIEKLFFTNNQKTAMGVAEVRGVLLYIASKNNLKIGEYTPMQIKVAVTGYGKADKNDIAKMVPKLITLQEKKYIDDEMDAIAIGLTFFAIQKS